MKTYLAKTVVIFLASLLLTAMPGIASGQGAPAQMDAALLDLSGRLGYSVGIGSLSNWRWEQTSFANDALGCPTASSSGGGSIVAYKFELTHNGVIYDYRVSSDSALTVYCGTIEAASAAAVNEPQYSNRLCGEAAGGPYMRSRAQAGIRVEVLGAYLNLRAAPSLDADPLMQIPAGWTLEVTAGPDCVDGYVWWLALVEGQTGYIAEAGDSLYFVAPIAPPEMPSRETLVPSLAPHLLEFGRVYGNFQPAHDWSSDSRFLILPGAVGSDGVWVYDLNQRELKPQILDLDEGIATLAASPTSRQLAIGSETGSLRLWQIHESDPLTFSERLYLNAHAGAVSAIAFSADGNRLASAGREAYTHSAVDRSFAALIWDLPTVAQQAVLAGSGELIHTLAFHPEGRAIFSAGDESRRLWDAGTGALVGSFGVAAPLSAAAFGPEGALFAWAQAAPGASLEMLDAVAFARIASYPAPTVNVTSLGFSPDGSMLVAGAAEGLFTVWDAETHELLATRQVDGGVHAVSFSPDGALIAVSTDRRALILFGAPLGSG